MSEQEQENTKKTMTSALSWFYRRPYTQEEMAEKQTKLLLELLGAIRAVIAEPDRSKPKWERRHDRKEAIRELRNVYSVYSSTREPSQMQQAMWDSIFPDTTADPKQFQGLKRFLTPEKE